MACFFCDIQDKEDDQRFLENDLFLARFDDFPVNPGHAEIIIKKHLASFFDLTPTEVASLYSLALEAKHIITERFSPVAFTIGINDGVAAGQSIPHLHMHLIPRYPGDVSDPRGGVRAIIPGKGNYLKAAKELGRDEYVA